MENGEFLRSFGELITEWKEGHPARSIAKLAKKTGVSKGEISYIVRGRMPRADIAMKLGSVLPADEVLGLICEMDESCKKFFGRLSSHHKVS